MPIRVLFDDRERSEELTIINTSKRTNTYRLEWGYRRMKEEGGYEQLEAPLDATFDAEKSLIFSPRQVTIAPGENQRVRLSLRRPADLPDGEYRAHLLMKRVSDGNEPRTGVVTDSGISAQMGTNVGFSIPVIVRQGAYDAGAVISDPEFVPPANPAQPHSLHITVTRTGIHSVAGSFKVYWTPPGQEERFVGEINNINIFHEITKRRVGIVMHEANITSGTIRIVMEGIDEMRGTIIDEKTFPVGG
ncbi:MAG TPA: hypothetical protein PLO23_01200 [Alphaproteobacteria bacterium]|nr:hypothetical protein [Alphaproteobacteria bacterium]